MNSLPYALIVSVWTMVIATQLALLGVLIWRKAWRANTAFTMFIAFCVVRSCLLLCARFAWHSSSAYSLIWWMAYVPQSVLLIALVLEVIQIVFRPYEALPRGTLGNFALAIFAVLLLTIAVTVKFPGSQPSEWMTFLRAMDQGVSWGLLSVFTLIIVFASMLGIPWNHRVYGIVVGFVFYLSVDVVVVTLTAQMRAVRNFVWPLDMVAFLGALTGWTYAFAHAEVPRRVAKLEEVNKIATLLSQYVFVIESLEVRRTPGATLGEPALLRSEGQ